MKNRRPSSRSLSRFVRAVAGEPLRLEREAGWLVVFSICDLLMTYALLWQGAHFFEANPLARWWFARWNIAGMTAYKFLLVGVVIAISEYAERHKPGYGRLVLWIGIIGAAYAFLYGASLFYRHVLP